MPSPLFLAGLEKAHSKWGWFVGLGILLTIVGVVAIQQSVLASIATVVFFGWLLVFSGVAEAVFAFYMRDWGAFFLHLLGGAIDLVLGFMFISNPAQGAAVLTLFLACLFFVGGAMRIVASIAMRFPGWGWSLVNGIITFVLGVMLWKQWPYDGLWFIGFCVGLEMIFRGWAWVMLGFALKQLPKPTTA